MALIKEIEESNGVVTKYHRVASLFIFTNEQNTIEVRSYTSIEKREEEAGCIETGNWDNFNAFIEGKNYNIPYDQNMTIKDAYNYLKTLPEFEGAING